MLSLARVLVDPPRLLIADELSLGPGPDHRRRGLRARSPAIKEAGTTLLIIEQHVHHALEIADDVVILHQGRVAFHGPADGLADLSDLLSGGLDA